MLTRKGLDLQIQRMEEKLNELPVESKDYGECLDRLEKLRKMRVSEKTVSSLSPGEVLTTAVWTAGMLLVCTAEYVRPVTTKVLTMLPKLKI